jgi:NADH-quinone oxidoreductase subunit F
VYVLSEQAKAEIRALQARYPEQRSALGMALYVAQREAGWLPPEVMAEVAELFDLPASDVGEFASFYEMLHDDHEPGQYHIQVCTNVPCMLRGSGKLVAALKARLGIDFKQTTPDGRFTLGPAECLGACGTAPMFMCTEKSTGKIRYFEELDTPDKVDTALSLIESGQAFGSTERWPVGPYRHAAKADTNYLLSRVDKPDSHTLDSYLADGGYEVARGVITGGVEGIVQRTPAQVIDEVKAANLRGRGGAGFPAGQKWSFLPAGVYPRYLVINADESEPGTFKDRMIMEYDPHQLIEGILLTAYAIESERAFVYVRGEYYFAAERLANAIAEARARGFLGENIFGSGKNLEILVHRGAGAYECGEETALLSSLEGYRGQPRLKPPFPAVAGLYRKPTIVNNVETISNVAHILRHGADWYKQWGTPQSPGFRIYCLSGQVKYPGLYELPHGTSLRELIYDYGGGPTEDAGEVKAVVPGGLSMQMLDINQLDTPLDNENLTKQGSSLGSAGVIVIGKNENMVEVARRTLGFYHDESCGKCTPCREGTGWLEQILERVENGEGRVDDISLMLYIADMIAGKSFCPFSFAAVWGLQSNIAKFRPEFEAAIAQAHEQPVLPVRPIYRPDAGSPSGLTEANLPEEGRFYKPLRPR